jgi:uncharacterized membrane protein
MKILTLLLAIVLVGVMTIVWIGYNPAGRSATEYVTRQQAMIRLLNVPMPLLGAVTILLSFICAYMERRDRVALWLFVSGALLLIGAGVITRFCSQPINAVVITWNAQAPPAGWESLKDQWWRWHIVRTTLGFGALALLLTAYFRR